MNYASLIGIALWALIPGFIAKRKGRNFWGYFFLSFLISPLITMIITLCLSRIDNSIDKYNELIKKKMMECTKCGYKGDYLDECPQCGYKGKLYSYEDEESINSNQDESNNAKCGTTGNQSKVLFCRKCGVKLLENEKFCRKCGAQIVKVELQV